MINEIRESIIGNTLICIKRNIDLLGSKGIVFMLHRVAPINTDKLTINENLKISPEFLDYFLDEINQQYDVISILEIKSYLSKKHKKPFAVFTLDDGYKDNYTIAYPIFKKHNTPFTVFVASSFPKMNANLWWYEIEDLILNNNKIKLSDGSIYDTSTKILKNKSFSEIRLKILSISPLKLSTELNYLFSNYHINWSRQCKELCMSWNDIKDLQSDSLFTLGAHTANHYNLKALPQKTDVINEIKLGIIDFHENLNFKPDVFAYPFGSSNEVSLRETNILKQFDFKYAFRSYGGAIKNDFHPTALPRIAVSENFSIKKYLTNKL